MTDPQPFPHHLDTTYTAGARLPSVLGEVMHALETQLPDALRTALSEHLWAQIAVPVWEWASADAQPVGVPLVCTAQTQGGPELLTSVVYSLPAGATGTLTLGAMRVPVVGGAVVQLAPLNLLVESTAVRSITTSVAGPVALFITGEQRPAFGVMSR
jgi:hypothetical protein